jgi:hypothetical protein
VYFKKWNRKKHIDIQFHFISWKCTSRSGTGRNTSTFGSTSLVGSVLQEVEPDVEVLRAVVDDLVGCEVTSALVVEGGRWGTTPYGTKTHGWAQDITL